MCGRARATLTAERVAAASGTSEWVDREAYVPRYNARPGTPLPCVRASDPTRGEPPAERRVESMTWGLVPSFTGPGEKPDHFRMFNARGETLREKPAFGRLLRRRRCVALIDGFYEWRAEGGKRKQPYYLYLRGSRDTREDEDEESELEPFGDARFGVEKRTWDDSRVAPMRCAALYDVWRREASPSEPSPRLTTCAIVTVAAADRVAWLHDRMPAVLRSDEEVTAWLAGGDETKRDETERETRLLRPYAAEDLAWHPVTEAINASGELEGPRCCAPAARAAERDAGSVAGLFAKAAEKTSREKRAADAREEETPETFATTAETFGSAAGAARRADAKKKKVGAPSPSRERKRARTATTFAKTKQRSVADLFGGKPRSERG